MLKLKFYFWKNCYSIFVEYPYSLYAQSETAIQFPLKLLTVRGARFILENTLKNIVSNIQILLNVIYPSY